MATLNVLVMCRKLNMMAFVKILKKFEKITGKQVLSIYLKVVESSYFNSSDQACVTHIYILHLLCPSVSLRVFWNLEH